MNAQSSWISNIDARLQEFIAVRSVELNDISPHLIPFTQLSEQFFRGGKKFRAQCVLLGFRSVNPATEIPDGLVDIASALELFHGAALVHDDVMDRSDTRRGMNSIHKEFEILHEGESWAGDARHFGASAALLFGDLILAWSDELFSEGVSTFDFQRARASRREFDRMRWDVTAGQYLDIVEENAWPGIPGNEMLQRAERVVIFKSAKYSVEAPLLIGASLAGADEQHLQRLSRMGIALGSSFQLRDDMLGVFGDASVTGKPSGDDLREGKRTMLVAFALESCSDEQATWLNGMLGNPTLTDKQISEVQDLLVQTGAVQRVEALIASHAERGRAEIDSFDVSPVVQKELHELADKLVTRSA